VGGTDFDDFTTQTTFWNPSTLNAPGTRESALGYIHEIPWNDSCAATATSANLSAVCAGTAATNIVGGSGGPSGINAGAFSGYAKPAWQSGIIPNGIAAGDKSSLHPDVSLFASDGPQSKSFLFALPGRCFAAVGVTLRVLPQGVQFFWSRRNVGVFPRIRGIML